MLYLLPWQLTKLFAEFSKSRSTPHGNYYRIIMRLNVPIFCFIISMSRLPLIQFSISICSTFYIHSLKLSKENCWKNLNIHHYRKYKLLANILDKKNSIMLVTHTSLAVQVRLYIVFILTTMQLNTIDFH